MAPDTWVFGHRANYGFGCFHVSTSLFGVYPASGADFEHYARVPLLAYNLTNSYRDRSEGIGEFHFGSFIFVKG